MPGVTPPLPDLVLYARPGCHLCEEARQAIELVLADRRSRGLAVPELVETNIETDDALHREFMERIPVIDFGGRRLELIVTASKVRRMLEDAIDRDASASLDGATRR
jgi:Glutaredoxin-like domain (DUF836)